MWDPYTTGPVCNTVYTPLSPKHTHTRITFQALYRSHTNIRRVTHSVTAQTNPHTHTYTFTQIDFYVSRVPRLSQWHYAKRLVCVYVLSFWLVVLVGVVLSPLYAYIPELCLAFVRLLHPLCLLFSTTQTRPGCECGAAGGGGCGGDCLRVCACGGVNEEVHGPESEGEAD